MSAPTYMSLFSACGGMDLGLDAAGWRCIGQAEVEPWRRDVLERHWPGIKRYDDVRAVVADGDTLPEQPDLIAGGFPCQDLSVAGKRKGLAGERSGLAWEFMRIIRAVRPRCVLIENVPGLLSSNQGRDMAALIGTLAELGDGLQYGVAYRILDSQWFGVPQRRRRVFIVGIRADGDPATAAGRAAQVLAIGTRCEGPHPSSGKEWPSTAASAAGSTGGSSSAGAGAAGRIVSTLVSGGTGGVPQGQMVKETSPDVRVFQLQAIGQYKEDDLASTMAARQYKMFTDIVAFSINAGATVSSVRTGLRRLTPVECERLQGWPDDHTRWDANGKEASDAKRYSATGDGVTANVAEWIGNRIREALL